MMDSQTPVITPPVPLESESESLDQMMDRATSLVNGTDSFDKEIIEQFESQLAPQPNTKCCEDLAGLLLNALDCLCNCFFCFQ